MANELEERLTKLIAEHDGVRPEDVTLEYIRQQRVARFYRTTRYENGTPCGGYDATGLKFYTREELDRIEAENEAALAALDIHS